MPISVSVQETTIVPANDGYDVQLRISDKEPDALDAALVLTLRIRIDRPKGFQTLRAIQREAIEEAWEAVRPMLQDLYETGDVQR